MTDISRRAVLSGISMAAVTPAAFAAETPKSTQRPTRRPDRALTQEESLELIKHTKHAAIATVDASGQPYVTTITPIYLNGKFYFHSSNDPKSRRAANLSQNNNISMIFVGRDDIAHDEIPKHLAVNFASAIVEGTAVKVTDEKKRHDVMMAVAERFTPIASREVAEKGYAGSGKLITVWEITPTSITGKARNKHGYFNMIKSF